MSEQLRPDGVLIVSGLLLDDREGIRASLTASGFAILEELSEHEWIAFAAKLAEIQDQTTEND